MSLLNKHLDRAVAARDQLNSMGLDGNMFMRLSGFYAVGPIMPNGMPEFGYRDFTGRDERAGISVEATELVHNLLDRMTPAQAAPSDGLREAAWQLMGSAPKDGTLLIVASGTKVWLARWDVVSTRDTLNDLDGVAQFSREYGWRSAHGKDLSGCNLEKWAAIPDFAALNHAPAATPPAAPALDLLEAAKAVEAWWVAEGQHISHGAPVGMFMLRQAISKAEGKP